MQRIKYVLLYFHVYFVIIFFSTGKKKKNSLAEEFLSGLLCVCVTSSTSDLVFSFAFFFFSLSLLFAVVPYILYKHTKCHTCVCDELAIAYYYSDAVCFCLALYIFRPCCAMWELAHKMSNQNSHIFCVFYVIRNLFTHSIFV